MSRPNEGNGDSGAAASYDTGGSARSPMSLTGLGARENVSEVSQEAPRRILDIPAEDGYCSDDSTRLY
jgi:hypothetical protein